MEKLEELKKKRNELETELKKTQEEIVELESDNEVKMAERCVGKYYKMKESDFGEVKIFKCNKSTQFFSYNTDGQAKTSASLIGTFYTRNNLLNGSSHIYIGTDASIAVNSFRYSYKEITEEEFEEEKKEILAGV